MKRVFLAAIILLSFSCKSKKADLSNSEGGSDTSVSVHVKDTIKTDTSELWVIHKDDLKYLLDSLDDVIRSKDSALFEANFKLARVWYYDSLCLKNSKLEIYLTGWVRRALEK